MVPKLLLPPLLLALVAACSQPVDRLSPPEGRPAVPADTAARSEQPVRPPSPAATLQRGIPGRVEVFPLPDPSRDTLFLLVPEVPELYGQTYTPVDRPGGGRPAARLPGPLRREGALVTFAGEFAPRPELGDVLTLEIYLSRVARRPDTSAALREIRARVRAIHVGGAGGYGAYVLVPVGAHDGRGFLVNNVSGLPRPFASDGVAVTFSGRVLPTPPSVRRLVPGLDLHLLYLTNIHESGG